MGNAKSLSKKDTDWKFVGRENHLNKLLSLLDKKRIVEIFGILQIGKSRLLERLILKLLDNQISLRKKKLLYFDFQGYQGAAKEGLVKCLNKAFDSFNRASKSKVEDLQNVPQLIRIFEEAVEDGTEDNEEVIAFLDNLQVVEASTEKETFLKFVKGIIGGACQNIKFVVTTNDKIGFTSRGFESCELGPLTEAEILELLHEITEGRLRGDDNMVYMDIIAKLCEGLPLAAMITATELKDDDFFIRPREMLEILFQKRLEAMSPGIYPAEEQLSVYKKPIEKVEELTPYLAHILKKLAENTSGTTVTVMEAVQATGSDTETNASMKQGARQLKRQGVIDNLRGDTIGLPGMIRECTLLLKLHTSIDHLPEAERHEYEDKLRKSMRENVDRSGLDIPDEALENPRKLEAYLKSLGAPEENEAVQSDDTEAKTSMFPYEKSDTSNLDPTISQHSLENNLDGCVSSTMDDLDTIPERERKILNSPLPETVQWNIQSGCVTGSGTSSDIQHSAPSELYDEPLSILGGPQAMSWKNGLDTLPGDSEND